MLTHEGYVSGGIGFDYTPLKMVRKRAAARERAGAMDGASSTKRLVSPAGTAQGRLGLVRARLRRLLR